MDIPTQTELLGKIAAFCTRHDIAETRFGRDAVNNPAFIRGLRDGKSPTLDTLNKVADFMARTDAEAATRAKLDAPLDGPPAEPEEIELPFRPAPVTTDTGASSPTSSPMNGRPMPQRASASCRSIPTASPLCSDPDLPQPLEVGQTRAEGRTPGAPPVLSDREA